MNTYQKIACTLLCICTSSFIHTAPKKPKPTLPTSAPSVERELTEVDPTTIMLRETKKRLAACDEKFAAIKQTTNLTQQAERLKEIIDILCKDIPSDLITRIKNAESSEKVASLKDNIEQLKRDLRTSKQQRDNEKAKAEREKFKAIDDAIKINRKQSNLAASISLAEIYKIASDFSTQLAALAQEEHTPIKNQQNSAEIQKFYKKIKSEVPPAATQFSFEGDTQISIIIENLWVLMATINVIAIFGRTTTPEIITNIGEELMQQINDLSELKWPPLPDEKKIGLVMRESIIHYIESVTALAYTVKQIQESFKQTAKKI